MKQEEKPLELLLDRWEREAARQKDQVHNWNIRIKRNTDSQKRGNHVKLQKWKYENTNKIEKIQIEYLHSFSLTDYIICLKNQILNYVDVLWQPKWACP